MPVILFDQNVPRALGHLLTGCEFRTAADNGWGEMRNGELMRAAAEAGFSILVTADQNIIYQQNMQTRPVGLIVLSTNHWLTLRSQIAAIRTAINELEPNGYAYVECGLTPKRSRPHPRL